MSARSKLLAAKDTLGLFLRVWFLSRRTGIPFQTLLDAYLKVLDAYRVSLENAVIHWLDTPVGGSLDDTPASLLAAGRDDVVGMLALGRSAPEREGYVLTTPMDTGGLTDSDRARREIAIRRSAHEEPGQ